MSALTRLVSFVRVGGQWFRGPGSRSAGGSGVRHNGCHQGHFPYPDPSQWTDEELGILPDDED
ncbi:NADH dehydrogenase [ubiquinone] 1 beta subcomplex subunit 2, mitochondrial [Leptonychotes weddellii]|uniref:NADH dehydrogenase [ubiquinone] 1 beta subcomplex subunit 2, mitochondrial n=1 Tax=Leptonychotes weddellii TaxID=9713 RepID=A0A7F8QZ42_LEPWE|nr:NADH dehydrogenase [ubiquinone] 1 beta subcomplex subunit 2, mitochondrial [Leptonychotes weddellii]